MDCPAWWHHGGLFEKYGERALGLGNPIYVDYAFLLTPFEALEWDKQCREAFSGDVRSHLRNRDAEMLQFEAALKSSKWVIVESYEWESGLD